MRAREMAVGIWRAADLVRGRVEGVGLRDLPAAAAEAAERGPAQGPLPVVDSEERAVVVVAAVVARPRRSHPRRQVRPRPPLPRFLPGARGRPLRRVREGRPPRPLSKWAEEVAEVQVVEVE